MNVSKSGSMRVINSGFPVPYLQSVPTTVYEPKFTFQGQVDKKQQPMSHAKFGVNQGGHMIHYNTNGGGRDSYIFRLVVLIFLIFTYLLSFLQGQRRVHEDAPLNQVARRWLDPEQTSLHQTEAEPRDGSQDYLLQSQWNGKRHLHRVSFSFYYQLRVQELC